MKTLIPGLVLVGLLVLLAVSPLFPPGLPSIADAPIHLFRTMELVSAWRDGVYYPRWAPNLAFGYGYPLFNFAPPLPYFIAGAFHVLGFSLETSIKFLAILCMAIYGLGMYLFARNVLGGRGAVLAATAYLYTPFRFREILLYGGNYPQILAIGLFPWVLWAFERIIADGRSRYVVAGALCFSALVLSHNFHAFIFTPLLLAYIVVETLSTRTGGLPTHKSTKQHNLWNLWRPILALLFGLTLTAFFWAPALHDLQYTFAQQDYYLARSDFRPRLLSLGDLLALPASLDGRADNPYVPFSLGIVVVVLAGLGIVYLLLASLCAAFSASQCVERGEMRREIRHLAFFLIVLLGASLMMLYPAALLWETLPLLAFAEFPWRLMGIANLAAAFLAGGSVRLWEWGAELRRVRPHLVELALAVSLIGLILGVAVYMYPTKPFQRWGTPSLADYIGYEVSTQNLGTTGLAEYLPKWAEEIPTSSPLVGLLRVGSPTEKLDRSALPPGVQATMRAHGSAEDRYEFSSENAFRARFLTFYFPGWNAFLDGQPATIHRVPPLGLMAVDVPAGDHQLVLRFGETPFRLAMDVISLLAVVGLIGWVIGQFWRRRERNEPGPATGATAMELTWARVWPLGLLLVVVYIGKVGFVDTDTAWFRKESPPDQVLGVHYPMDVLLEDNIRFLGYDLVGKKLLRAGDLLHVRLYWQADALVSGDYVSFVHLDAPPDDTTFATADNFQPGDPQAQIDMPSTQWRTDLYVRDEHRLMLPDEMPPIAYALQAGLYERETGRRLSIVPGQGHEQSGDTINLQELHVLPSPASQPPTMQTKEKYRLGDSIELLGYSVTTNVGTNKQVRPGQAVTVTLYWQAFEPVAEDYSVFVHLVDTEGQVRAQHDGPPMNGRYPTYSWLPNQIVEDETVLILASDLPPGDYRITAGMYKLETGQRLEVEGANGHVTDNAILLEPVLGVGSQR